MSKLNKYKKRERETQNYVIDEFIALIMMIIFNYFKLIRLIRF